MRRRHRKANRSRLILLLLCMLFVPAGMAIGQDTAGSEEKETERIHVGTKAFTESVLLGRIISQLVRYGGFDVKFHGQMGGTRIVWEALQNGDIDIYPEYTGTIRSEIFSGRQLDTEEELRAALEKRGISMTRSLGFENTYVLGMKESRAKELGIKTISDLKDHPNLRFGFTNEFMDRKEDGWPGLRKAYNLKHENVRGLEHNLAYSALREDKIDVMDLYSTDAKIREMDLRKLRDDRNFFPEYRAVILYRKELEGRAPLAVDALKRLEGSLDPDQMIDLNAEVEIDDRSEAQVAKSFFKREFQIETETRETGFLGRLKETTLQHLKLVAISLTAAILIAIPLGIMATWWTTLGQVILGITGIMQTIPALAMLVFMIPILSVGEEPAIAALFLYSLLPIVRNTYAGINDIPAEIRESAAALGLPYLPRLLKIELPMATRSILAGIKISAVINVGTATLGALIGAGGYGQPILTGIRLNKISLILEGAIPASVLALLMQGLFELTEWLLISKGLRLSSEEG